MNDSKTIQTNASGHPRDYAPFADLEYTGGGYFRDATAPKGVNALIVHGPELLAKAQKMEALLAA